MKKMALLLFSTIGVTHFVSAQFGSTAGQPRIEVDNLVPKSPQAAELVRVNEINLNGATGVPNISFTLYTASIGGLKIPITISYNATGIKYDDIPSVVGLKWTLDAGGEVSRSINGQPDELGFVDAASTYTYDYFSALNPGTSSTQDFLASIASNHTDISVDQYSYNYLDRSGAFYFRNNKFLDCKNPFTIKIKPDSLRLLHKFNITDDAGNIGYFGDSAMEVTIPSLSGNGYVTPNLPSSGVTAWKLIKLRTYTKEEATFEYDTCTYETTKLVSESYTFRHPADHDLYLYNCNCGTSSLNDAHMNNDYGILNIKKIHTPSEDVQFYYSSDNSLDIFRRQLDSIVVKDKVNQSIIARFHFKYGKYAGVNLLRLDEVWNFSLAGDSLLIASFHYNGNGLIGISSLSRDLFNYNNGSGNTHLISTNDADYLAVYGSSAVRSIDAYSIVGGILDTIYSPTGGKTAFSYSPNFWAPGVRVDSIKYINKDNSIATKYQYMYDSAGGEGFYYSGYMNSITYDNANSVCPVKTISSEINESVPVSPFCYRKVQIRKVSGDTTKSELTQEFYTEQWDGYSAMHPALSERIYFRNNDVSDTLKIETYSYADSTLDSLGVDWLKPAEPYLPGPFYDLDGYTYSNEGYCTVLYIGAGRNGINEPRNSMLVKQQVKEFDQSNSSLTLTTTTTKKYNDKWQNIADIRVNSKGDRDSVYYTYLYTDAGSLSSSVTSDNLLSLVKKTTRYKNGTQIENSRVSFSSHSGTILADSFFVTSQSNAEHFDKMITGYDTSGQITEVDNKHGFYTSLLRDYNNHFLVAQANNARLSQIAYSSFEAESKGGWTYSGTIDTDYTSPTGGKRYSLSGSHDITKSGLTSATYIVSYWSKNGSAYTVNGSSTPTRTGKTISGWTYYEHEVTGTSITISGSNYIDEVRLYPKGSTMTTYTFGPLGLSSQCDVDNRINYYEYDAFGRLRLVKDQDKNILKVLDYKYQQSQNQ